MTTREVEMREGTTTGLGLMAAFLGGALAGTLATLLLAPRSGAETRRRIADAFENSREKMKQIRDAGREAATAAEAAFKSAMQEPH